MHRFALLVFVAILACTKDDSGDDSGGDTAEGSDTVGASSSADDGGSEMSGSCDAIADCTTCWKCAKQGVCKEEYDACAASFECAGSLACIDYMCPPDNIPQTCLDHCCQNCEEHLLCNVVDTAVSCIENECAQFCGSTAVCG
jgi:hypothetical protein